MNECAEMRRLQREENDALEANMLAHANRVARDIHLHWNGCSECQGLAPVEQQPVPIY